jgi:hypothetical protein
MHSRGLLNVVNKFQFQSKVLKLEPILRLFNLQLQRQRCSRLERFFKVEKALGYSCVVLFYSAGVVNRGRRLAPAIVSAGSLKSMYYLVLNEQSGLIAKPRLARWINAENCLTSI